MDAHQTEAEFFRFSRGKVFKAYSKNLRKVYEDTTAHYTDGERRRASFVFPIHLIRFDVLPADVREKVLKELAPKPRAVPKSSGKRSPPASQEAAPRPSQKRMRRPAAATGR